jgi:zona occludens toxin (predicted ATPase)
MLNDKGRKIVKEKRGNQVEESNHYYNMDEEDISRFDNDWRNLDNRLKFNENHQKYLKGGYQEAPKQRALGLGYEPRN